MYQQSKGSAEKPKAVSYFNQFPRNFLKPYGKADSPPDEEIQYPDAPSQLLGNGSYAQKSP